MYCLLLLRPCFFRVGVRYSSAVLTMRDVFLFFSPFFSSSSSALYVYSTSRQRNLRRSFHKHTRRKRYTRHVSATSHATSISSLSSSFLDSCSPPSCSSSSSTSSSSLLFASSLSASVDPKKCYLLSTGLKAGHSRSRHPSTLSSSSLLQTGCSFSFLLPLGVDPTQSGIFTSHYRIASRQSLSSSSSSSFFTLSSSSSSSFYLSKFSSKRFLSPSTPPSSSLSSLSCPSLLSSSFSHERCFSSSSSSSFSSSFFASAHREREEMKENADRSTLSLANEASYSTEEKERARKEKEEDQAGGNISRVDSSEGSPLTAERAEIRREERKDEDKEEERNEKKKKKKKTVTKKKKKTKASGEEGEEEEGWMGSPNTNRKKRHGNSSFSSPFSPRNPRFSSSLSSSSLFHFRDLPRKRLTLKCSSSSLLSNQSRPWIFRQEIQNEDHLRLYAPCIVNVTVKGNEKKKRKKMKGENEEDLLGFALYNSSRATPIAARIFSWDAYERFDRPFVAHKLRQAAEIRRKFFAGNAFYRVCNGEADGLPGVILDRYGSNFVLQLHASGLDEFLLPVIQPAIEEVFEEELSRLILRNDSPIRSLEHLPLLTSPRILAGRPGREEVGEEEEGEQPSLQVEMIENGCSFLVDLYKGDTTGWTFYHRNTRDFLASLCKGRSVLEVYSRHGGSFGVQAASRGASCVVSIHPSADIVKLGNLHIDQNCLSSRQILFLQSDISLFLQSFIQRQQEEEESKEHKNEEEEEERKRRERKRGELCGSLPSSSSSCCKAFREIDGAAPKNDGNRSIDMLATDSSSSFASSSLLQRELDTLSTCTFTSSSLPSRHSSLSSSGYHPSRSQKDSNTLSSSLSSSSSAFSASPCSSSSSSPSSPPSSSDHRNPLASFASPEQSCRYLKDGDKKEDKPRQEEQRGCSDVTSEASLRRRDIKISQKDMNSHLSCNSKRSLSSSSRFSLAIFPPGHPKQSTESMLLQAQEAAEKTLDFLQSSSSRFYSSPHPQSLSRPYLHHNRFRRQLQNFDVVILDLPVDIFPSSSLSYFHVKNENLHLLELLFQQALAVTSQDGGLLFFSVTLPGLKRQDFHRLIQKGLKTSPRIEKSHESDREECEEKERRRRIRRCRVLNEGGVQSIDHPTDLGLPFSPSFTHCILLLLDS